MPKTPDLLFASERTAARLVDMKPDEFRALVDRGLLPPPRKIGNVERFDLAELQAVIRGDLIGGGEMKW
jgi:hypothetical protein